MSARKRQESSHGEHKKSSHCHGSRRDDIVWEWFWSCCFCCQHGSMSTAINVSCPGCNHVRCVYFPLDAVKVNAGRVVRRPDMTISTSEAVKPTELSTSLGSRQASYSELLEKSVSSAPRQNVPLSTSSEGVQSVSGERRISGNRKKPKESSSASLRNTPRGSLENDQANSSGEEAGSRSPEATPCIPQKKDEKGLGEYFSIETFEEHSDIEVSLKGLPKFFACPYNKLDPRKYGLWTDKKFKDCPGSCISELRNIKQNSSALPHDILTIADRYHLMTAHTLVYCKSCFRPIDDPRKSKDHYRPPAVCEPSDGLFYAIESIQESQWEQIDRVIAQKGKKCVDDDSRWYDIWRILYPGVKVPRSTRVERPGYIAGAIYGIDELLLEFEQGIEEDVESGIIKRDEQLQRCLFQFRQTLEACSAGFGSMQLGCPAETRDGRDTLPIPVRADHADPGDILLACGDVEEHPSTTLPRGSRQQGSHTMTMEDSGIEATYLTLEPPSSRTTLPQDKDQPDDINDDLPGALLSPFCGNDFDSEAAHYLTHSALAPITPGLEKDSYD